MRLSFIGAAHEVTGSCHLLEACGKNILIDCGMEQGPDLYENQKLPVSAGDVDYVLLTHAHIDHSGNLPLLCTQGFQGDIVTTFATADLCSIMLRDSAHIQELRRNGETARPKGAGKSLMNLFIQWRMQIWPSLFWLLAITGRRSICVRASGMFQRYGTSAWLSQYRSVGDRRKCYEKNRIFR